MKTGSLPNTVMQSQGGMKHHMMEKQSMMRENRIMTSAKRMMGRLK